MDWKRVIPAFLFACAGSLGLMLSMPLALGLCEADSNWCSPEPTIFSYIPALISLMLLLFGMARLAGAGHASYRVDHPKLEKPVVVKPEPAQRSGAVPEQFDREAELGDMKKQPVFGSAKRRPVNAPPLGTSVTDRVQDTVPPKPIEPAITLLPVAPASASEGQFDTHLASSPMAPRFAPKPQPDKG